jgi:hypothetical protein
MSALHRYTLLLVSALIAAIGFGCATTRIQDSWRDPDFSSTRFDKTLLVFQSADPGERRILEDEMARAIPHGTPAYQVLRDEELRDIDRVKAHVRELGFDSAVVMRIANVKRDLSLEPPMPYPGPYGHLWGYWGFGWNTVYDPAYLRTDETYVISTNVYDVPRDKLVWASRSETFNPASLRSAIAEVVKVTSKATGDALRARG